MELELKTTRLEGFDIGAEQIFTQEETADTIVPDYCPDIARIIDTEGKVFLHSRELRDGKGEISGTIRVTVLYTPDGESGIRTLEFAMPFSSETDGRAMNDCVFLCAAAEIECLETRILNPRKVFTRCKLILRLTGYRKQPLNISADAEASPELCLEKKQEPQHISMLTQLSEKDFTFSDEMDLSPGKEGAAEILTNRASALITESKTVGNKLILKGIFHIDLLYRSVSGRSCSTSGELPFSQIMEVSGVGENALISTQLQFTGTDIQVSGSGDQDGRRIAVTLYLHAVALLRQEQTVPLLKDLYSTSYDLSYEAEPIVLTERADMITRRQTVREVLEVGVVADSLLSLNTFCGSVTVGREGDHSVLRTAVTIRALYLDEGGVPLVAERCVDVSCHLDLPEDCHISARSCCPEEVQGSLGDRGIEVRFPVEFQIQLVIRRKNICISAVKLLSEQPKDLSGAPSLVLRGLGKDEDLWALAKQHNTTTADILAANGLTEEEEIPRDRLLLIPKKR